MSGALSPVHWLIIIGVLVLLFGAKKLPDAARGVARSPSTASGSGVSGLVG